MPREVPLQKKHFAVKNGQLGALEGINREWARANEGTSYEASVLGNKTVLKRGYHYARVLAEV